ncbi:MAG: glycosyltransferase family 39 protein [Clostridia bacterium]|nr:glycosyltransferase family 39 protein [Clostridia bacterium]
MKKIIYLFGILFLAIVLILNVLLTANLDGSEHITIRFHNFGTMLALIVSSGLLFFIARIIDERLNNDMNLKSKKRLRKILLMIALIIYVAFSILWVIVVRPAIVGDQIHACNLAQTFYRDNAEEFLPNLTYAGIPLSEYMQAYHQQISLAFVFSMFFRLIQFDGIGVLRVLNVIGNILIVFALYKITVQLSKTYRTNKVLLFTLILTFISLPMLATFIYGDIPALALCLWSVYFMMRYTETKNVSYPIFASILTMLAYMLRMNSLIFIIATVIYLLLNLFKNITTKTGKENVFNLFIIIIYIAIAILPSSLVKNYYLNKYELDKNKAYPNISYFLMAMEEGPRANGWYNEGIGEPALKADDKKAIQSEYAEKIKQRLTYFSQNFEYTFDFYINKIASMWTENTYAAVRVNMDGGQYHFENMIEPLTFYQKMLLIITCFCSLIVLLQNRKNLSLDVIFLITIFIGGFAFHILWEAKSRYILPYIVVLIPVASIWINKFAKKI